MGGSCREGQYRDALIKKCIGCQAVCKQPQVSARCIVYCESAYCKAQAGHYYDMLLKKCVRCAEVCGGHPAECSQHCQNPSPPVTTKKLLLPVTPYMQNLAPTALEDSTIILYSMLALCMMLLLFSLSLALAVLLRGVKAKISKPRPKGNHHQEGVVQPAEDVVQPGKNSKDFVTNSNHTTDREPSYDSSPCETCACVHCFPHLKALGQGNDRPLRAPFSFYQQAVLHKAPTQNGGPLWNEENLYRSGPEVQEEAVVG